MKFYVEICNTIIIFYSPCYLTRNTQVNDFPRHFRFLRLREHKRLALNHTTLYNKGGDSFFFVTLEEGKISLENGKWGEIHFKIYKYLFLIECVATAKCE